MNANEMMKASLVLFGFWLYCCCNYINRVSYTGYMVAIDFYPLS